MIFVSLLKCIKLGFSIIGNFESVANAFLEKVWEYQPENIQISLNSTRIDNGIKIKPLQNLSKTLSEVSLILHETIQNKSISAKNLNAVKNYIEILNEPFVDVEVVIVDTLKKLTAYCEMSYLSN